MIQPENLNDENRSNDERPMTLRKLRIPKEVVFYTPVMLGMEAYQVEANEPRQVSYFKNDILHPPVNEEEVEHLPNGMLVDFPVVGLEDYWESFLWWLPDRSDEDLVEGLLNVLARQYRKIRPLKSFQKRYRISEL